MLKKPKHHDTHTPPKAMLWLESSVTALHLKHMAALSRELCAKGFEVVVLTSEDTMKQFTKNGGKMTDDRHCAPDSDVDFGSKARFLPELASQTTYQAPGMTKIMDRSLTPFEFIGSTAVLTSRHAAITQLVTQEKPDALVNSLWPSGYGPFTKEIEHMIATAKSHKPEAKVYSLSNDLPYLDYFHNDPYIKGPSFDQVDRTFIRGDGAIRMEDFVPLSRKSRDNTHYVGHYIDPLPPRTDIPDKDRKVLVTYGTRESEWNGSDPIRYFLSIMRAAPQTKLAKNPWDIVVGPHCSDGAYRRIEADAEYLRDVYNMRVQVRRGVPDKAFRQDMADAAMRIAQYDPFVLDDLHTGVPAVITTGNIERYSCGSQEGDDRLNYLVHIGAPIAGFSQYSLQDARAAARGINLAYDRGQSKSFSLPTDAAAKTADILAGDFKARLAGAPDPEVGTAEKVTQQTGPKKRSVQ